MERFKTNILQIYGEKGKIWLDHLPHHIQHLATIWSLSQLEPLSNLSYSYILSGFQQGNPIILKLNPDLEAIARESTALRTFKEFGAVSVIDQQDDALLLARAIPGESLKNSSCKKDNIEIACKVIEKLQQAPLPEKGTFPHIRDLSPYRGMALYPE